MRRKPHWHKALLRLAVGIGLLLAAAAAAAADLTATARHEMVKTIVSIAQTVGAEMGPMDSRVLAVMDRLPRDEFVPDYLRPHAYDNRPLPIGYGQTISQPYIVAAMTDLLELQPGQSALEIGTGSGYQAAVLAELGAKVSTIEIVEPLAKEAAARLSRLGYTGVATKVGDGYYGWPARGPFDAIIVTAAASHVPPPLVQQLKPGGRMVIPIGALFQPQQLVLVQKHANGSVTTRPLMAVAFVPLTGGHD